MSNRMFQNVILQMKEATNRQIGVIDSEGCVIACTDIAVIGEKWAELAIRISSSSESLITFDKKTFKALTTGNAAYFDYAVYVSGDDEAARSLCLMAYVAINSAKIYYEEKHDKSTFVKNIIMDNILPGDIYIRAKELHFATDVQRAVLLVRQNSRADIAAVDVLQGMFTRPAAGFRNLHQRERHRRRQADHPQWGGSGPGQAGAEHRRYAAHGALH